MVQNAGGGGGGGEKGGGGGGQAKMVESGSMLVGMELGIQQVDVKLGRIWMEMVMVEWEAKKLKAS